MHALRGGARCAASGPAARRPWPRRSPLPRSHLRLRGLLLLGGLGLLGGLRLLGGLHALGCGLRHVGESCKGVWVSTWAVTRAREGEAGVHACTRAAAAAVLRMHGCFSTLPLASARSVRKFTDRRGDAAVSALRRGERVDQHWRGPPPGGGVPAPAWALPCAPFLTDYCYQATVASGGKSTAGKVGNEAALGAACECRCRCRPSCAAQASAGTGPRMASRLLVCWAARLRPSPSRKLLLLFALLLLLPLPLSRLLGTAAGGGSGTGGRRAGHGGRLACPARGGRGSTEVTKVRARYKLPGLATSRFQPCQHKLSGS